LLSAIMHITDAPPLDASPATLTTGAAHDLRNVLFLINAHSERLLRGTVPDDPRHEDLRAIRDAAARGARLARQMVSSARELDRPRPVDVNAVIAGMEPLLARLAGDRVSLHVAPCRSCWPVSANAVQLEQVLMNLVVNARDAMSQGGRITIATENRTLAGNGPHGAAHFVVLSVSDTGTGIDPQVEAHIFDPFFTTREGSGGTGVGLTTVRAIALLNGGHVELSTTPGEGTTVRVVLPRSDRAPEPPGVEAVTPAQHAAHRRVLLVENEAPIREFIRRSLSAEGFDVQTAATGAEALRFLDPAMAPLDVVVTDVHLPDAQGPDVAKQLRAQTPNLRVVFMSGGTESLSRLSDAGEPVLAKPFTTSELVATLQSVLAGRAA
jgi:two-component system, cell cycle sensor histidine kinase and response regulator CckA